MQASLDGQAAGAYDRSVTKLDDAEIDAALGRLPDWSRDRDALVRTYQRRDWTDAIALVNAIAPEAERRNHHPDVSVTDYRNVTFRLTTHSKGGITQRDIDLATWIEEQATASNGGPG
jgi:4a-hydroxytetrahydrobiopterin dehydratase